MLLNQPGLCSQSKHKNWDQLPNPSQSSQSQCTFQHPPPVVTAVANRDLHGKICVVYPRLSRAKSKSQPSAEDDHEKSDETLKTSPGPRRSALIIFLANCLVWQTFNVNSLVLPRLVLILFLNSLSSLQSRDQATQDG